MKKPTPQPGFTHIKTSARFGLDYLLFLPENYQADCSKTNFPCILFLHGAGERGADAWKTATHGPAAYLKKHPDFPFILIQPLCASGSHWSDDLVLAVLDEVKKSHSIDTRRIYVTGLSMGGYETWSLLTTHPELFAAAAPVCGGEGMIGTVLSMQDPAKAKALKSLPVWVFHGAKDDVVPWTESERMVRRLGELGNNHVEFTTYPDFKHNCWTVTYDNPELYAWFLRHDLKTDGRTSP